ncbi:lactate permease [Sporomusaceae bacterium BoRhaA]|uniref:L-lactate permease n=1 Tax=Pelorhabdus rhamnosifermentans TaxID=2772457 RepID=UPI001C0613AB|nr:L-lactate permease [Pelorhabdus rhamnosifermentans]MBU2701956.1 lactate permease [Pelorhabdus rhamnosifermentans]
MWEVIVSPYGMFMSALLAFIPLLWLLVSLGIMKMPAYKACIIGLVLSFVIAIVGWGMPFILSIRAALEGVVLALWPIIWVILAAIFTYNVTLKTGAMETIKGFMGSLSGDRRIQALIIAWGFGGFLEAAAGFGTAVAIPASILIGLGFNPFFAAVICLIANTVPVAFGAVGIPITTLAKVADVDVMQLTYYTALQLTPFVMVVPLALVLILTKSMSGLKGVVSTALVAGVSFAIPQLLVAKFIGPELTAIVGSIVSMFCTAMWARISPPKEDWKFPFEDKDATAPQKNAVSLTDQMIAWSPYVLLFVLILGTSKFFPAINSTLGQVKSMLFIYNGPEGKPMGVDWLITPGTLIMIAAVVGGLVQGASITALVETFGRTVVQLQKTILTIVAIVSMAKVMGYSGMIAAIALALAKVTGPFYPVIAPAIGALGTFVTGSDTSANVLFGALQKQTALAIGADPTWVTASNTTGATAGKMISPQSIAVACSATGQEGQEGAILAVTIKYCIVYVIVVGVMVYAFA